MNTEPVALDVWHVGKLSGRRAEQALWQGKGEPRRVQGAIDTGNLHDQWIDVLTE